MFATQTHCTNICLITQQHLNKEDIVYHQTMLEDSSSKLVGYTLSLYLTDTPKQSKKIMSEINVLPTNN
jgi:hypothetical protein